MELEKGLEVYYKFLFNKQLKSKNSETDYNKFINNDKLLYECFELYGNEWWDIIRIIMTINSIYTENENN